MKIFFKRLFCFHSSWAKCGWKSENFYVCKNCFKVKNFGFNIRGPLAFPNFPINFDQSDDTWWSEK